MLPEITQEKLVSEIELFIEYGVVEEERALATDLVKKYLDNPVALAALLEFYKVLPEAREEAVNRIGRIDSLQGVTLLALSTANHTYVTVVTEGEAHILGEFAKDETPREILNYFGHSSHEEFISSCGEISKMVEFGIKEKVDICPACGVSVGEHHLLGCPVEICPWCDGQLSKCNCRFEKLDIESFDNDEQVEAFQDMLETKGRVPYDPEQTPAYPGTSDGLDKKK